jgi:secreted trypsin-like serine protease
VLLEKMMDKKFVARVALLLCLCHVSTQVELDRAMRIVGGQTARVGQFPHAVALVLHLTGGRSSFCGGSIIHPNYVLTVSIKI